VCCIRYSHFIATQKLAVAAVVAVVAIATVAAAAAAAVTAVAVVVAAAVAFKPYPTIRAPFSQVLLAQ
jgi:hypothetical protein